jgi:hypothetical protein
MTPMTDSGRFIQPITGQIREAEPVQVNQEIVTRVTGLIQLGTSLLNILIVLRYVLELVQASRLHAFASLIYAISEPFLSVFAGLTRSPQLRDVALELNSLIAIMVYSLLGWIAIQLVRILFANRK